MSCLLLRAPPSPCHAAGGYNYWDVCLSAPLVLDGQHLRFISAILVHLSPAHLAGAWALLLPQCLRVEEDHGSETLLAEFSLLAMMAQVAHGGDALAGLEGGLSK